MNLFRGFLDNDSALGQLLLRCWAIIICNLCFVLTTVPVITAGAGWAAMDYALMNTLKNRNTAAPFRDFWKGFKDNFRQATVCWIAGLLLLAVLALEWYWCRQFGGIIGCFRIGLMGIAAIVLIILVHVFPVMAAFRVTFPQLLRTSIYFAFIKPAELLLILFVHIVPMVLTYMDLQRLPLYAFLWCSFGFGAVSLLTVHLLLRRFLPFLGTKTEAEDEGRAEEKSRAEEESRRRTEKETLEDMQKLGM